MVIIPVAERNGSYYVNYPCLKDGVCARQNLIKTQRDRIEQDNLDELPEL